MFRLQIAEDEPLARQAILHSIDFALHGFEVVAVSEDGREAIRHFEAYSPDLVITDINMPHVSGLEVAKHIAEAGQPVRVVILTGYDEFEFARQAIQYGVSNYILKPVTAKEFGTYLDAEYAVLVDMHRRRQEQAETESHLHASRPVILNDYLCRLIQGTTQETDREETGIHLGTLHQAEVALIRVDDFQATARRLGLSWDLLSFAILNVMNELAEPHAGCRVFQLPDADSGFLWVASRDGELPGALLQLATKTVNTLKEVLQIETCLGIGDLVSKADDIPRSYREAKSSLDNRSSAERQPPQLIREAMAYVEQHFCRSDLSLFDMTRHLNVSISHFTNQFKEFTGKTFIEYLTAKRIDVAKHKLKHTDLMLYRIASDVGYENPTYFASIFKKYVGIAPTQYRKLYQQRDARQTTR